MRPFRVSDVVAVPLLFLVGLNTSPPIVHAQTAIPIEGKGAVVGNSGAFTYSIPIAVPPGRHGLAPNLALIYNSSGGNGIVGVGWDLPIGYVMRSTRHGVDYNCNAGSNCFVFMLGGASSELVPRTDWCSDCYGSKIEGAFIRFRYISGSYWEATDKAGTKYRLGYTSSARQDGTPGVFKWMLDTVTDTNSNSMTYTYQKNQGEIYLDQIDYANTSSVKLYYHQSRTDAAIMYTPNFSVTTAWRLRTIDVWGGGNRQRAYKLQYDTDPNMVGDQYSVTTGRSLLTSVQQFGKDATLDGSGTVTGETDLPAVTLGWQNGAGDFSVGPTDANSNAVGLGSEWNGDLFNVLLGDFNGDGRTDILRQEKGSGAVSDAWGTIRVVLSIGDGTFVSGPTDANTNAVGLGSNWNGDLSNALLGDFDGDGRMDILRQDKGAWAGDVYQAMWLRFSNGDGTFRGGPTDANGNAPGLGVVASGPSNWNGDLSNALLGDFDGDGRTDILRQEKGIWASSDAYGSIRVYFSNGDGTFVSGPTDANTNAVGLGSNWNGDLSNALLGDFDGDGRTDILRQEKGIWASSDAYGSIRVYFSNGDGTFAIGLTDANSNAVGLGSEWNGDLFNVLLGDFNGDGRTDILRQEKGSGAVSDAWGTIRVVLSIGDGTFVSGPTDANTNAVGLGSNWNGDLSNALLGDFDGDGRMDILRQDKGAWAGDVYQAMWLRFSNGDGTFRGGPTDANGNAPGLGVVASGPSNWNGDLSNALLGDFNGNGRTDILRQEKGIWASSDAYQTIRAYLGSSVVPDLLVSVSSGLGAATNIDYVPSPQYANTLLPFPIQTVSQITTVDGNGNTSTTTYTYSGGFYYAPERDFRGFNYVKVTGPAGPNGEQAITETWYHQGDDVAVDANNLVDANNVPIMTVGYMAGRPYRTRVSDSSGQVLSEITTSYVADSTAPYFNPPAQVLTATALCGGSPCGKRTQTDYFSYDAYGNLTQEHQSRDISTTADDRTVFRSFYQDSSTTSLWIMGLPATEIIYKGLGIGGTKMSESRFYYDNGSLSTPPVKGNLTKLERWLDPGNTYLATNMVYDTYGNLTSTTDAKGYQTTVCYDASATFPQRVTNPLSRQAKTEYYGVSWNTTCGSAPATFTGAGLYGQVKTVTDPNTAQTKMEYDPLGRSVKVTRPDSSWTSTAYVSIGGGVNTQHIRTDTDAGLSSWTYFDGLGRTIRARTTGPDSKIIVTETHYDSRGAAKQSSLPYFEATESPTGRWAAVKYDSLGRPRWVTNPDTTTAFACTNDWVSIAIDATGHKRRETRDAAGRMIQVDEYTGTFTKPAVGDWTCATAQGTPYATTTYEYNVVGNLVKVTDAKANRTTMRYDTLGRKIGMADPDMGSCGDLATLVPATSYPWYATPCWNYKYDNNGNLERQRDAKNQTIWFQYDNINRLRQKDYNTQKALGSGNVIYTYDTLPTGFTDQTYYQTGRLSQVVDSSGTARFGYDQMGRIKRTDKIVSGTTYTTKTTYGSLGRVATVTYPDVPASTVSYEYNGPLLKRVYEGSTNYIQYATPNALGQPASVTYGNNVVTSYTYANIANSTCPANNFRLCTLTTTKSGVPAPYQNLSYGYDSGGNVTGIGDSVNGGQSFVYGDSLNRLTSATGPYGAGGAQATFTYAYNEIGNMICNSQISACSGSSPNYIYPTSGPSSVRPHAVTQAGSSVYGYDANGNMSAGPSKTLSYDAENRPTSITVSGATTTFVYDGDGGRVKKTTGGVTTTYIGKLYECSSTGGCSKYIFAGGQRIALKPVGSSSVYYYHTDHLGSSGVVTDQSGVVVESLAYYPYGQTRLNSGGANVHHKYTGQELDDSSGLYFYNARYYDPVLGRFIQADTIVPGPRNPQNLNRYSYVVNNPIRYTDPSGRAWYNPVDAIQSVADSLRENPRIQNVVGLGIQAYFGPSGFLPGAALLSQNETGRNILAGEIIVGTAVATFYCGGCGAAPVLGGALAGEVFGGYGSYRNGGGYLTGVGIGGLSGSAGGAAGIWAGGLTTLSGAVAAGATGGFTQGVGYTLSYGGTWRDAWQAGYQGATVGASIGAVAWGFNEAFRAYSTIGPNGEQLSAQDASVFSHGENVFGSDGPGWCQQGTSFCSRIGNSLPLIGPTSVPHDGIVIYLTGQGYSYSASNYPTMFQAFIIESGAVLHNFPSAPLTIDQTK